MLYTLIQIVAFQALFLIIYDLFLRKETFFNYNRTYLLLTSILALILPFIKLPKLKQVTTQEMVIQLPEVFLGAEVPTREAQLIAEQAGIVLEQPSTPLWQIIFGIGAIVATICFTYKILKIYWLKHKNPQRWKGQILLVKLINSNAAFSFFNTVFLGEQIAEKERETIYLHELVHAKEKHTLDLLWFEIWRILFWFSPTVYIYQNRIKELHEFTADAKAIELNGKTAYYESLLHQIFDVNTISFTNTFFKNSLIKKRIAMLQKSKSKQIHLLKYMLLLPMVFGMLIYTSIDVRAQQDLNKSGSLGQEVSEEELIMIYYDIIVKMEKKGATFFEIADYAEVGKKNMDEYIMSMENYLKSRAYMHYLADSMIKRESEAGTLTDQIFETAEKMKNGRSYTEYRKWKKTQEAKNLWEAGAKDGEMRLLVNDLNNKTQSEQKRYEVLLRQLNNDSKFNKLLVSEAGGMSKIILYADEEKNDIASIRKVTETIEVPFHIIDEIPTYPECKKLSTNEARKKCMNNAVSKFVGKNFNMDIANALESKGLKRIFVQFKVDTLGNVTEVKARAPHVDLETEAKRVIKLLPQFTPGRQNGKAVMVPYALPIVINVSPTSNKQKVVDSLTNKQRMREMEKFIKRKKDSLNKIKATNKNKN